MVPNLIILTTNSSYASTYIIYSPTLYISSKIYEITRSYEIGVSSCRPSSGQKKSEVINNSNRMRRKNVVFYNIPERVEGDDCTGYINALANKIDESIDIEEAHRSPTYTTNLESGKQPRPIHALCFRRQHRKLILEKGPSFFKENLINDKRISVSDDVHPATRLIHKRLLEKQKEFRQRGWFAFIPWTVPRRLKYRPGPKGSKTPMKTFLLQS